MMLPFSKFYVFMGYISSVSQYLAEWSCVLKIMA